MPAFFFLGIRLGLMDDAVNHQALSIGIALFAP